MRVAKKFTLQHEKECEGDDDQDNDDRQADDQQHSSGHNHGAVGTGSG